MEDSADESEVAGLDTMFKELGLSDEISGVSSRPSLNFDEFLVSYEIYASIKSCLTNSSTYVPAAIRTLVRNFLSGFLPDNTEREFLVTCFSSSKFIPLAVRKKAFQHFKYYQDELLRASYKKKSPYVFENKEVTPFCRDTIRSHNYINSISSMTNDSDLIEVSGTCSEETFHSDLRALGHEALVLLVKYTEADRNDSFYRYGDTVAPSSMDVSLLPLSLASLEGVGRGTIGAFLALSDSK
jgi:hypothetical protein